MSRSKPQEHSNQNPATRWFDWAGGAGQGHFKYYDKAQQCQVEVPLPMTFILLDQLGTVGGWNDASQSAIYANEVKDTRTSELRVRSFKGGPIVDGLYSDIKSRVRDAGGHFTANCYVAYKADDGALSLGSVKWKGSALGAWMEFSKEHRASLYEGAVVVTGYDEGKKGSITYRTPTFKLVDVSDATNNEAVVLDRQLQTFLASYLESPRQEPVPHLTEDDIDPPIDSYDAQLPQDDDDPLPF